MKKHAAVLISSLALVLMLSSFGIAGDKIIVGKKGEVMLSSPTQIGDQLLPSGHYLLQHRTSGNEHFLHFTELKMFRGEHLTRAAAKTKDYPEIRCSVEPVSSKISQTTIETRMEGNTRVVTRIEIRGENVAHTF